MQKSSKKRKILNCYAYSLVNVFAKLEKIPKEKLEAAKEGTKIKIELAEK